MSGGVDSDDGHTLIVASTITRSAGHHGHSSFRGDGSDNIILGPVASCLTTAGHKKMRGDGQDNIILDQVVAGTITTGGARRPQDGMVAVPPPPPTIWEPRFARNGRGGEDVIAPTIKAMNGGTGKGDGAPCTITENRPRRLTPLESERLQGFPDNYTAGQSDQVRYKQCGNAVAVTCAEWIGRALWAYLDGELHAS